MKYYSHVNEIKYGNKCSENEIEQEIHTLLKRLHDEPYMSLVRSVIGDAEIVIVKEIHEDSKEYLRITVNRKREELIMRLQDFNLLFNTDIPSSLLEGECEECNKKNE